MNPKETNDSLISLSSETLKKIQECEQEILDAFVELCDKNGLRYYLYYGSLLGAIRHRGPIPWDDGIDVVMPRDDLEALKKIMLAQPESSPYRLHCFETDSNQKYLFLRYNKKGTIYRAKATDEYGWAYQELWIDIEPLDNVPKMKKYVKNLYLAYMTMWMRAIDNKAYKHYEGRTWKGKSLQFLLTPFSYTWLRHQVEKRMKRWNSVKCEYYLNYTAYFLRPLSEEIVPQAWFEPAMYVEYNGKRYRAPYKAREILTQFYGDYMKLPPEDQRKGHVPIEVRI